MPRKKPKSPIKMKSLILSASRRGSGYLKRRKKQVRMSAKEIGAAIEAKINRSLRKFLNEN